MRPGGRRGARDRAVGRADAYNEERRHAPMRSRQPQVPMRLRVDPFELSSGTGRDFVILGRWLREVFSVRLMDGSNSLQVTWTESLGKGTLVNRLAQVQQLAGGPGSFTEIKGEASAEFQTRIQLGRFNALETAQALDQKLGGKWRVDVTPRPNSTTWDITATRLGD
jgi:hypothetical protein